jgi:hypothetical protein
VLFGADEDVLTVEYKINARGDQLPERWRDLARDRSRTPTPRHRAMPLCRSAAKRTDANRSYGAHR